MAVLVIIQESATRVVALQATLCVSGDPCLCCHIHELAIAEVLPERAVAPVGDEQVVQPIIVVVADAAPATPTGPSDPD